MNDVILENLIRKYRNKKAWKTIALALHNNLSADERQKVIEEIELLKNEQTDFAVNFKLK